MNQILLSGSWDFRLDGDLGWQPIPVPGCWEQIGIRKDLAGPAWYRTRFVVPPEFAGKRLWLCFGGVSYHCDIFVNDKHLGSHTGLWDAFRVEMSGVAAPGELAELVVRVEKPAGLTRGPDSQSLPGRFPLRETLSGFLPYVWGQIFGGIWQDVTLVASGQAIFEDVVVRGAPDGRLSIEVELSTPAAVAVEIRDPDGEQIYTATTSRAENDRRPTIDEEQAHRQSSMVYRPTGSTKRITIETTIVDPRPWSPSSPALYEARLRVADGEERFLRFGLRSIRAEGTTILLNERPIYPRMALSWGWYPEALNSNPGPERVRADFARLKQLGYNGVKLCLWFPPQYYFELADELGMLLWVELPMWIPQPSAFFRAQTPAEYERLMRQARNHPAIMLYTLGCELNSAIDASLLATLYAMVKAHANDALVRDNSGSGEAYGGLLNEFADYYDYHFYSELQFLRGLLDQFTPRWRPEQPWLFGEFCDYDTFRDLRRLRRAGWEMEDGDSESAAPPPNLWWTLDDPAQNPQGARWIYELAAHERRLRASGLWDRRAELERISEAQGLLHRKYTLELVRLYREVSGYVVTGETDTPISTAGMWDEGGRLKFDPPAFRAFNDDLVLLVGWDRQRIWAAGGDRAAAWDSWSYASGATVRPHLVASHYGASAGQASVTWSASFDNQPPFAHGQLETAFALRPGSLRELGVAQFPAPAIDRPRQIVLSAQVRIGDQIASNSWPLWLFPRDVWRNERDVVLLDPTGRLRDLAQLAPGLDQRATTPGQRSKSRSSTVVIATAWTPEIGRFVERGGRALLLQAGAGPPGPLPTIGLPFWREAIRLATPHPSWYDFPLDDAMGMQFFGCATDCALDLSLCAEPWWPIFRRLDARTMAMHEYAAELAWGTGRLLVTTLRFEGSQGTQPLGIARSTAAAYLLWCWVQYLKAPIQSKR